MTPVKYTGLLAGVDVPALRQRIQRKPYDHLWAGLNAAWRLAAKRSAERNGLYTYGSLGWYSISSGVVEAALAFRLGDDAEALAYVEDRVRHLLRIHATPQPGDKWPIHSHSELAVAADICRGGLAPDAMDGLLNIFRTRTIDYHNGDRPFFSHGAGGNTPFCMLVCAAVTALLWGEDCGHPNWKSTVELGRRGCSLYLRYAVDDGGFGYEGTAYTAETVQLIYVYAQLLRQNGVADLFATEPKLGRIGGALRQILFPDNSAFLNLNDHGLMLPSSVPWLLLTADYYRNPADLALWHAYQGPNHPLRPYGLLTAAEEARFPSMEFFNPFKPWSHALALLWGNLDQPAPKLESLNLPTAEYSPGTENAGFRTSWGPDAIFLNIAGAGRTHCAHGHAHADCGHFSIFAHGEYLAIDTGRYNSDEDQHNVVLIDGKCHKPNASWGYNLRKGKLSGFQHHAWLDYVAADSSHIKDCIWADRHVLFIRLGGDDAYVVTIDNLNAKNAKASYWWQLHTCPDYRVSIDGPASASIRAAKARLDLTFVNPLASDYPADPHQLELRVDEKEWGYGSPPSEAHLAAHLMATSARRPRLIAQQTGLNGLLMSVIVPRRADAPALEVIPCPTRRTLIARIRWAGGEDTVIAALDHSIIDMPDVRGMAELAVIRRDRQGKPVASWTVDGSPLTF